MKTQLLYVLVSSPADVYLEQAFVSATSARRSNPHARLVLLTDKLTADALEQRGPIGEAFRQLWDQIEVVPLDAALPAMQRSRILKTLMRSYVKGDFLFIDADTLVVKPLEGIDDFPAPLAACRDLHSPFASHPHYGATLGLCRKIGFDVSGEKEYFNSGVLLVKDTPENEAFFKAWSANYSAGYAAGVKPDQPSLAQTNAALGHPIALLPDEWNCEVQNGVRFLGDARIVHYMVTNVGTSPQEALFLLNRKDVLLRVRESGQITPEVKEVMEDYFKGYAPVTQVFAGDDLYLFRTRRYRSLRRHYAPGKWSLWEFLLKVKAHLRWQK